MNEYYQWFAFIGGGLGYISFVLWVCIYFRLRDIERIYEVITEDIISNNKRLIAQCDDVLREAYEEVRLTIEDLH